MSKCNLRWFKPSTCVAQALWITSAPKPQNPRLFLYLMLLLWNPLDIFTLANWLFRTHLLSKENPQLRSLAVEISQDPRFSLQKWEKIEDCGIWLESLNWPPKKIKKTCSKSQSQNRRTERLKATSELPQGLDGGLPRAATSRMRWESFQAEDFHAFWFWMFISPTKTWKNEFIFRNFLTSASCCRIQGQSQKPQSPKS